MINGFIKCAAANINVAVANPEYNAEQIKSQIARAEKSGVQLLVFPELCLTGYTCGDLFLSDTLISSAKKALADIAEYTADFEAACVIGVPIVCNQKLYNCAAVISAGQILGLVPKTLIPNYGESSEMRYFASAEDLEGSYNSVEICAEPVMLSSKLIFRHQFAKNFCFGVEICEDMWGNNTTSRSLCAAGATIIVNPAASGEIVGKADLRVNAVNSVSRQNICGYLYSNAAPTESTQDFVCGGQLIISENGVTVAENPPFGNNGLIVTEIDVDKLSTERRRNTSFKTICGEYTEVYFGNSISETSLTRKIGKNPFIPEDIKMADKTAEEALNIQAFGLKKRFEHTKAKKAVIGISGGLDSCLALLAMVRAMDLMDRPHSDILAVTMPCFGTSSRTRGNAEILCEELGVTLKTVEISSSVCQHFADIGQSAENKDITYENSQARERTQVLMDIANMENGMVIGTGDLSELALGWATYNGDHMSNYGVNASIPKTLVRYTVDYVARSATPELSRVLKDIVDTPVSPELLPADNNGNIAQITEDSVGPYALHDFFLYYIIRYGFSPKKVYRMALYAFENEYDSQTISKWLKVFIRRFFSQQFKRSCLPDGPAVTEVSLSPRAGFKMPSDATETVWLKEIEEIK